MKALPPNDSSERDAPILDVRPEAAFQSCHRMGAANIPLEELAARIHELPSPYVGVVIFDDDPLRAESARNELASRNRSVTNVVSGADWLVTGQTETGPSVGRLWKPHDWTMKAVGIAKNQWDGLTGRTALDVACGTGRDAVFLAMQGMSVEAWDVLPDAIHRLNDLAERNGVSVQASIRDVEKCPEIDEAIYDWVCCFNFLHRPLMPMLARAIRPGGYLVYETFVDPQREMFGKPSRESHVLRVGELPTWFTDYDVIDYRERLAAPRRQVASLIARRRT
ncbi:MAG: methyltransferase domain-containing protein [Planctomycetota bacterium]